MVSTRAQVHVIPLDITEGDGRPVGLTVTDPVSWTMQHFHDLLPIGTLPFAPSQSFATGPIRRGCLLLVEFRLTVVSFVTRQVHFSARLAVQ